MSRGYGGQVSQWDKDPATQKAVTATNGQVLTVDSTQTDLIKWGVTAADARSVGSRPIVGRGLSRPATNVTFAGNKSPGIIFCSPFFVSHAVTIDQIGIHINTEAADTNVRLGIYKEIDGSTDLSLIVDAGTIDSSTTGEKIITLSPTVELPAGRIWIAYNAYGAGTPANIRVRVQASDAYSLMYLPGTSTIAFGSSNFVSRFTSTGSGSAFPSTLNPSSNSAEVIPLYFLRVASVL